MLFCCFTDAHPVDANTREVKKEDTGKIRFAGGNPRIGDDQSDCAEDITRLCPEIPKGNNFGLLACLQEKAKV